MTFPDFSSPADVAAFDEYVARRTVASEGGCLVWAGAKNTRGYGESRFRSAFQYRVHRAVFVRWNGPIPVGMVVCHKCDNPPCCNPDHLFAGTLSDNRIDCREKGRENSPRGEVHHAAKIDEGSVRCIREAHAAGERQKDIAAKYGLDQSAVSLIVHRKTWAHVA